MSVEDPHAGPVPILTKDFGNSNYQFIDQLGDPANILSDADGGMYHDDLGDSYPTAFAEAEPKTVRDTKIGASSNLEVLSKVNGYASFTDTAYYGQPVWTGDLPISTAPADQGVLDIPIVPNGAGGAIIVWGDFGNGNVFAQRITGDGQVLWQENGVSIAPGAWYQFSPRAVSDGDDGVVVVWVDGRNGWCGPSIQAECDIFAQRICIRVPYAKRIIGFSNYFRIFADWSFKVQKEI